MAPEYIYIYIYIHGTVDGYGIHIYVAQWIVQEYIYIYAALRIAPKYIYVALRMVLIYIRGTVDSSRIYIYIYTCHCGWFCKKHSGIYIPVTLWIVLEEAFVSRKLLQSVYC